MKKLVIYYFLSLFSLLSIFSSGVIDSQDGFQYLAVARNIYYKGEFAAPVYEYDERKNIHMSTYIGKNGNTYSPTGLGFSLAMLPAVVVADLVYKIYGVPPPVHFPLENDWLIFLAASFTNAVFGAILGTLLLLYLIELGLSKKQALFISLVGLLATNLLVYTKHSFAHMMFTTFLFAAFFLIKKHFQTKKNLYLTLSGVSFGITTITYNQTFILAILPLGLYLLLLSLKERTRPSRLKTNLSSITSLIPRVSLLIIGFIPFLLTYTWFENLRAGVSLNLGDPVDFAARVASPFSNFPITVFFEGLFGQLFSPGRSIFLYSPILLLLIFFWHRIKKNFPELWTFLFLSAIYILYISTRYSGDTVVSDMPRGIAGLWHGELSWGPRYLTPLIPMGLLIVGSIYTQLKKREKFFVFFPSLALGFYVGLLGLLMPYQIKLHGMEGRFFVNSTEFPNYSYTNFLPRYSPIIQMSKNLIKLKESFPKTFDHGPYNVKYYDGIDFPFNVGPERWRSIEGKGYISFDNNLKNPVKELTFGLINHPIEASESAKVQFLLNNKPLLEEPFELKSAERELIEIPLEKVFLKPTGNNLVIQSEFDAPVEIKFSLNKDVTIGRTQILGLQSFDINGQRQNLESIDVPYVSSLGPKMAGVDYQNWGGTNKDPWKYWDIHTQIFERLPDFWWLRNLYYWDIPKSWILTLFGLNLIGLVFAHIKVRKYITS